MPDPMAHYEGVVYEADQHRGGAQLPWENLTDDAVQEFVQAEHLLAKALATNSNQVDWLHRSRDGRVIYRLTLAIFDDRVVIVERREHDDTTAVASVPGDMISLRQPWEA